MDVKKIMFLHSVISSLVFAYGPISENDILEHANYYFGEHLPEEEEDLFFMVLDAMQENGELIYENGLYSVIPQQQYDAIYAMEEMEPYLNLTTYKVFDDPEELLKFESFETMAYFPAMKNLNDYIDSQKMSASKKEKLKSDCYGMSLMIADFNQLPGIEKYSKEFLAGLRERIDAVTGFLPRGFFKGYSFDEIGEMAREANFTIFEQMNDEMLEVPDDPKEYGHFSYSDCRKLAEKLKTSGMFRYFNSDNVLELFVNGNEVFCQLLGYYSDDHSLLIYKDVETMLRNYYYLNDDPQNYPDMPFMAEYLCVSLDDYGSFMNQKVTNGLFELNEPNLPLAVSIKRGGIVDLPTNRELDLIGAVISYLLEAYEKLDKNDDFFNESDFEHIYQIYLDAEGHLEYTRYEDPFLGTLLSPVQIKKARKQFEHEDGDSYYIGIFALPAIDDKKAVYLLIIYNSEEDEITVMDPVMEEDLGNIGNIIVDTFNECELAPNHFISANHFTYATIMAAFEDYDGIFIDDEIDDQGILQDIYRDFVYHEGYNEENESPELIS